MKESLDELALNVNDLVDRLTMDMADAPVGNEDESPAGEKPATPAPPSGTTTSAAAPPAEPDPSPQQEENPVASLLDPGATTTIDDDPEIMNLAGEMIEALVEQPPTAATPPAGAAAAVPVDHDVIDAGVQADRMVDSLTKEPPAPTRATLEKEDAGEAVLSLDLDLDKAGPQDEMEMPATQAGPAEASAAPAEPAVFTSPEPDETNETSRATTDVANAGKSVVPWSPAESTPATRGGGRPRWMWIAAGILVMIGAGAAWTLFSPGDSPAATGLQATNRTDATHDRIPAPAEPNSNPAFPSIPDASRAGGIRTVAAASFESTHEAAPDDAMPVVTGSPAPAPERPTATRAEQTAPVRPAAATPAWVEPTTRPTPRVETPAPEPSSEPTTPPRAEKIASGSTGSAGTGKVSRLADETKPTPASVPSGDTGPPVIATVEPPPKPAATTPRPAVARPAPALVETTPVESATPTRKTPSFPPPQAPVPTRDTAAARPAPSGTTGPALEAGEVEPPQLLSRQEPIYPTRARKRGEGGIVELRILVNEHGRVVRVVVEEGIPGSELEARAIDAALRSTYVPATRAGESVRAWVTERFVFEP